MNLEKNSVYLKKEEGFNEDSSRDQIVINKLGLRRDQWVIQKESRR